MPFTLRFGPDDLLHCRFALSPLWETQEAVRMLRRPGRHAYHLPWLRRIREAAAGLDLAPLWLLMPQYGFTPNFTSPPPSGPSATFEEEIAAVRGTGPEVAHRELVRSLECTPGAADSALGRALAADPDAAVVRIADTLGRAWEELIAPYWPRLRALLDADIAYHSRRLADGGLARLFADLHPRISWDAGTLTIAARSDHARVLSGEGLLLVPSVFCWPDVVGGFDPPWQATIAYPARGIGGLWTERPGPGPHHALARLLGPNRAAVLDALAEPASTSALAHRLGLAPSSVSAHLGALRGAALLSSRRQGHQVLYERTPLGIALAGGGAG